jgi:hypothetical protein
MRTRDWKEAEMRRMQPALVTFIDQGNNSKVPLTSLVCMSEKLSTLPPLAHHCTMAGLSREYDWSEEAGSYSSPCTHISTIFGIS